MFSANFLKVESICALLKFCCIFFLFRNTQNSILWPQLSSFLLPFTKKIILIWSYEVFPHGSPTVLRPAAEGGHGWAFLHARETNFVAMEQYLFLSNLPCLLSQGPLQGSFNGPWLGLLVICFFCLFRWKNVMSEEQTPSRSVVSSRTYSAGITTQLRQTSGSCCTEMAPLLSLYHRCFWSLGFLFVLGVAQLQGNHSH